MNLQELDKVLLIIQDPRMSHEKQGSINHEFTVHVDLAPNLLKAAHINPSTFMQGRDISELYIDIDIDIDDVKGEEHENTPPSFPFHPLISSISIPPPHSQIHMH